MSQFQVILSVILVRSLFHKTSTAADLRPVLRITWSLSSAICAQRSAFELETKIQLPLRKATHSFNKKQKQLCSYIRSHNNCELPECRRFQCETKNGISNEEMKPLVQQRPSIPIPTNPSQSPNIIVRLKRQQKCEAKPLSSTNRASHLRTVVDSLKTHATKTQASVLRILESSSLRKASSLIQIQPLWIINEIIVNGASLRSVQEMLEGNKDVGMVREERMRMFQNPKVSLIPDPHEDESKGGRRINPVQAPYEEDWNLREAEVGKVWPLGVNGNGIIVGHIDTGALVEHEALKSNFRGEYGWFDPYAGKPDPYDDHGHGTHTLGIMAGQTKQLGAAPGVTWMSCKGCKYDGNCTESATKTCAQWILCPTKSDGTDPDCSKAPHIVNNSWGDPILQDGSDAPYQAEFDEIIECWREGGIIPVFCIGNSGDECGTTWYPGLSDKVIGVGNVKRNRKNNRNHTTTAQGESSQGPPHPRFKQVIKPDVSCPGTHVTSASWKDPLEYRVMSGTSQAAPLVSGTIALMLHKNPSLKFDDILRALAESCSPVDAYFPKNCGGVPESTGAYPNNHVGYGLINAYKAVFGTGDETLPNEC